jgi:sulfotransferase
VVYDAADYDATLGMPGLHQVRRTIDYRECETFLPPDLFAKYADANFWLSPKLNRHHMAVI